MEHTGGDVPNDIGTRCFNFYKQCVENLKKDDPSEADEIVVAMWRYAEACTLKSKALQNLVAEQQKELARYSYQLDIAQSRIALLTGSKSLNVLEVKDIKEGEH